MHENDIEIVKAALREARKVFVLTGAGISAESGVPTFRGGGTSTVWRGRPFEELSSAGMVEKDLPLVWEWFDYRRGVVGECVPNAGHRALAEVQKSGRFSEFSLVTQNIDGLHSAAGSTGVIELHGSLHHARCLSCGSLRNLAEVPADERPPVCPECFDSMRPNVVLFGENLSVDSVSFARGKAESCDVCLVVGTSGLVHPANELPLIAKRAGAFVVEINPEETVLTSMCGASVRASSSEAVPNIFDQF
jgi:NAD-dependent deacetylase